jgi:type I restriction enzyme M protein
MGPECIRFGRHWPPFQSPKLPPECRIVNILSVERDNPNLWNKLPRDYARRGIEPVKRKGLIDLIANIGFKGAHKQARDTLGRVYEYFLGKSFAPSSP